MKQVVSPCCGRWPAWLLVALFIPLVSRLAQADQVEMQNGDRYHGKVLSLDSETLVLQNEVLGPIRLPRAKIATINLGAASIPVPPVLALTNKTPAKPASSIPQAEPAGLAGQLRANSNIISQVQSQFLSGAGAEAQAKFDELVSGLLNGKLNVDDIRGQAKSAADRVRAARKDLGEDAGWALDGYLAILDQFLKDSAPEGAVTNRGQSLQK